VPRVGAMVLLWSVLNPISLVPTPFRLGGRLAAQAPNLDWRTIQTEHFYVHFTPPVEGLARRLAVDAERAYAELSKELHPPRGMINLILSDDVDLSNGLTTVSPVNRIIVYATPPVGESELRYTNDWGQLVVTHELTHVFHLDRTRGIWVLGQDIFGRSPFLFPDAYSPSWLLEGLAVYYESKLAGAGRIEGPEHHLIVRAAAFEHDFPALGTVSLATPRYPQGEAAYAYGSLFIDYLATTRGDAHVRDFVESESDQLIPYLIDIPAKHAFGISFSQAWKEWRDTVTKAVANFEARTPPGWRQLTNEGMYVSYPRWTTDSTIVYSGTTGREDYGAFRVNLAGDETRIGRRNSGSLSPQVLTPAGSLLYSQLEYVNPYQQRSDLYEQSGRHETQLTHGARLTNPDVRGDGMIVAEQIIPGGTRLVKVSPNGQIITPITGGDYDEQWTEPRWSHDGHRIVASRWRRGGLAQIVVIDTLGHVEHLAASGHGVAATPAWLPGDVGVTFAYGESENNDLYVQRFYSSWDSVPAQYRVPSTLPSYPAQTFRASTTLGGMYDPDPSPLGDHLAATLRKSDGFHLGVADCCAAGLVAQAPILDTVPDPRVPPIEIDTTPARPYSPWTTFLPRYWIPQSDQGFKSGAYRFGGSTIGQDVIGRDVLNATLLIPTDNSGLTGGLTYTYNGLGVPALELDASQDWTRLGVISEREPPFSIMGDVRERQREADVSATWTRQRYRSALAVTAAAGLERNDFLATPSDTLLPLVDTSGRYNSATIPTVTLAAAYATYSIPPFAISPEDGLSTAVTVQDQLKSGVTSMGPPTLSTVGTLSLYKALPLPGYSHSVFALHAAGGYADTRANGYFEVGGISGGTFQILPGIAIGGGAQTFGVRGFEPATLLGVEAFAGSAEYRMPLRLDATSVGILPFFLQRSSLTFFGDYGVAWCPSTAGDREVCTDQILQRRTGISSAGAELNVDAGLLSWDVPYRFRLGAALPLLNGQAAGLPRIVWYVTSGVSF
jgi:hypothetical protein